MEGSVQGFIWPPRRGSNPPWKILPCPNQALLTPRQGWWGGVTGVPNVECST